MLAKGVVRISYVKSEEQIADIFTKPLAKDMFSGERGTNTTIVCCVSPAGCFIQHMIIFKRIRMNELLKKGAPPGSWKFCHRIREWLYKFGIVRSIFKTFYKTC